MGYAGYAPAKLPPPRPSDLEAALRAVCSTDSLTVISTLCRNCAIQPKEDKFRKVKLSNKKIHSAVVDTPGALEVMLKLGWVENTTEQDGDVLEIPSGQYITMEQVRKVDEAKERLEKVARESVRMGKKPSVSDLEKERIRAQIEADRKERAVADPIITASVAQALPSGANIHQGSY
uniref:PUB domain-containing protein n=1 Tax=Tetraselmis sp. GSL018 TaxID=582737 RepID=A0A061S311_9CHLO|mmetsp:Transcript_23278/g.55717  ORF Transcript_23278/g.55717 Transcript_23278/m.55717 type:complete len:177 (+) Transcript_23278:93-623(+)